MPNGDATQRLDGADVRIRFFLDKVPIDDVETEWESGEVSPNVVQHQDKIMGKDTDGLDQRAARSWNLRGDFFAPRLTLQNALQKIDDARRARQKPPSLGVGFLITPRDGGAPVGFVLNS